jgi:hypothetical protein
MDQENPEHLLKAQALIATKMAAQWRHTLAALCAYFLRVEAEKAVNLMTMTNIAIVTAPWFFRYADREEELANNELDTATFTMLLTGQQVHDNAFFSDQVLKPELLLELNKEEKAHETTLSGEEKSGDKQKLRRVKSDNRSSHEAKIHRSSSRHNGDHSAIKKTAKLDVPEKREHHGSSRSRSASRSAAADQNLGQNNALMLERKESKRDRKSRVTSHHADLPEDRAIFNLDEPKKEKKARAEVDKEKLKSSRHLKSRIRTEADLNAPITLTTGGDVEEKEGQ